MAEFDQLVEPDELRYELDQRNRNLASARHSGRSLPALLPEWSLPVSDVVRED